MPTISVSIVEPSTKGAVKVHAYDFADFTREALVRVSIEIGQSEVTSAIGDDNDLSSQVFAYVRSLHANGQPPVGDVVRGGKTFSSASRPVFVFVRYRSAGTMEEIVEDVVGVTAIASFALARGDPKHPLLVAMLNMPEVVAELRKLRAVFIHGNKKALKINMRGHEFGIEILRLLMGPT